MGVVDRTTRPPAICLFDMLKVLSKRYMGRGSSRLGVLLAFSLCICSRCVTVLDGVYNMILHYLKYVNLFPQSFIKDDLEALAQRMAKICYS